MTTKRLLDDVDILKKSNHNINLDTNVRKRKLSESHEDSEVGGSDEELSKEHSQNPTNQRRQSTASARLSYSSTSTSSSSAESQFPSPEFGVTDFRSALSNTEAPILDKIGLTSGGSVFRSGPKGLRRSGMSVTYNDERGANDATSGGDDKIKQQIESPVNTSFESEFNTNSDISKSSSNKSNSLKAPRRSNRNARSSITS